MIFGHKLPQENIEIAFIRFNVNWFPLPIKISPEYPKMSPIPLIPKSFFYDRYASSSKIRDALVPTLKKHELIDK